jgi:predicted component of type VI protein secretion system
MTKLPLKEQIQNLQTILGNEQDFSQETRQILLKEIERLKQELAKSEKNKQQPKQ